MLSCGGSLHAVWRSRCSVARRRHPPTPATGTSPPAPRQRRQHSAPSIPGGPRLNPVAAADTEAGCRPSGVQATRAPRRSPSRPGHGWRRSRSPPRNPRSCPSQTTGSPCRAASCRQTVRNAAAGRPRPAGCTSAPVPAGPCLAAGAQEGVVRRARHAGLLRLLPGIHLHQAVGRRPSRAMASARAAASFGRSRLSMTSASRTASRALLVCSAPMTCSRRSGQAARSAGNFPPPPAPGSPRRPLPGGQRRLDRLGRVGLRDGDQGHDAGRAVGAGGGLGDPGPDPGEVAGDVCGMGHAVRTLEAAARRLKPRPGWPARRARLYLLQRPGPAAGPARRGGAAAGRRGGAGARPGAGGAGRPGGARAAAAAGAAGGRRWPAGAAARRRAACAGPARRCRGCCPSCWPAGGGPVADRRGAWQGRAGAGRGGCGRMRCCSPRYSRPRAIPAPPALGPLRWAALAGAAGPAGGGAGRGRRPRNAGRLPRWTAGLAAIGGLGHAPGA